MTYTARDHLERAVAWLTTYKHDDVSVDTRIATATPSPSGARSC